MKRYIRCNEIDLDRLTKELRKSGYTRQEIETIMYHYTRGLSLDAAMSYVDSDIDDYKLTASPHDDVVNIEEFKDGMWKHAFYEDTAKFEDSLDRGLYGKVERDKDYLYFTVFGRKLRAKIH